MAQPMPQTAHFFPKADAAILLSNSADRQPLPPRPDTVGPIFDPETFDSAIAEWDSTTESCIFPPKKDPFAASTIPQPPQDSTSRYLRASLAKNERLRLSMLWYYTQDIQNQPELLAGLQEKANLAQLSAGWEFAVIGILDMNVYIRLATVGLELAILPRGETICAHTVCAPPGNVFLMPNMMEDWRFRTSPYVEQGGLVAYAGVPLRMQHESGESVGLGSLCVASSTSRDPLTDNQQQTLARLGDWIVADIVQNCRTRRHRERHRFADLIAKLKQRDTDADVDEAVLRTLKTAYPNESIRLQPSKGDASEFSDLDSALDFSTENGLWEDTAYIDEIIVGANQREPPKDRTVRFISAHCKSTLGASLLVVATQDFRRIFDDVDSWFVQTCATILTESWQDRLLSDVMLAKEKFLRGVSHQLRTPVHGILGAAELLAEDLNTLSMSEEQDVQNVQDNVVKPLVRLKESLDYLSTISTAGQELMAIVNNMITLNRWADIAQAKRQYALHDIRELEDELVTGLQTLIANGPRSKTSVLFLTNSTLDSARLNIDLRLFRDSVLPLITNAVQNTRDDIVTVNLSLDECNHTLAIDVKDNGCGIPEQDQRRIFEPYEKVGELSTGAGLGLSLASKFSKLLNGSVELVSSKVNNGSHFRIVFRDVEFQAAVEPLFQATSSKLEWLPRRVHFDTSFKDPHLLQAFEGFTTSYGFSMSDSLENCVMVVDCFDGADQGLGRISRLPEDRIVICLLPSSIETASMEPRANIVYVEGPFSALRMGDAFEEADKRLSTMQSSNRREPASSSTAAPEQIDVPGAEGRSSPTDSGNVSSGPITSDSGGVNGSSPSSRSTVGSEVCGSEKQVVTGDLTSPFAATRIGPKPTALVVDDNAVNLRIMQMYCKKRGITCFSATDGQQAVDIYKEQQTLAASGEGSPIELVLMDLQMPNCDGLEATRQIRQLEEDMSWKSSTLFIVTGQDSNTDREAASKANADDFLVKPVGIKLLDEHIRRFFPGMGAL